MLLHGPCFERLLVMTGAAAQAIIALLSRRDLLNRSAALGVSPLRNPSLTQSSSRCIDREVKLAWYSFNSSPPHIVILNFADGRLLVIQTASPTASLFVTSGLFAGRLLVVADHVTDC